ncbi:hypothetical protein EF902_11795 [Streptomyces sp. WAC05858]|nr:hypothetical protein EF902_11795 [Streptomyces sp. WAC05858]
MPRGWRPGRRCLSPRLPIGLGLLLVAAGMLLLLAGMTEGASTTPLTWGRTRIDSAARRPSPRGQAQ